MRPLWGTPVRSGHARSEAPFGTYTRYPSGEMDTLLLLKATVCSGFMKRTTGFEPATFGLGT